MSNFAKRFEKAKGMWKTAKQRIAEGAAKFAEYEDGRYLMRCVKLELSESSGGRFQADFSWAFEEGEYAGQIKHSYQGLETEDGFTFFGRDLDRLGYEVPDDMTEDFVKAVATDIAKTKPLCRCVLKTKGEFQNLYINKLLSGGDEESDQEEIEAEPTGEEEAPTAEPEPAPEPAPAPAPARSRKGKSAPAPAPEPEEEPVEEEAPAEEESATEDESAEDEVDLAVGMQVAVSSSKGERRGEVIEILESEGIVRVRVEDGKVLRATVDKIEILADVAPEEPPVPAPAPKAKVSAKSDPAPVKKLKK